jgi:putative transposase
MNQACSSRSTPRFYERSQSVGVFLRQLLPREFSAWQTVYYHFWRWRRLGYWKRIHHLLRFLVCRKMNRHKHATAGSHRRVSDSQSVKTTVVGGVCGFYSGKRVKGRKRHLLCDTQGLALELVVIPASMSDSQRARLVNVSGAGKA